MKVLLVKTSSLGDVLHALPAVTDACAAMPGLQLDWMVEEAFAEIPAWHAGVAEVIPVAVRRWRKAPFAAATRREFGALRARLGGTRYDLVIDAQGLLKSAWLSWLAQGRRTGPDFASAREPLAALAYHQRVRVPRGRHAVDRNRELFAGAFGYPLPDTPPDFGIAASAGTGGQVVLVTGTTWPSKRWPAADWETLAGLAAQAGYRPALPWGNREEEAAVKAIAAAQPAAEVLPAMRLTRLRDLLAASAGVIAVDSGIAHLAAAVGAPTVCLYGPTSATLTGCRGPRVLNLAAEFECAPCLRRRCNRLDAPDAEPPCYASLPPARAWQALAGLMTAVQAGA